MNEAFWGLGEPIKRDAVMGGEQVFGLVIEHGGEVGLGRQAGGVGMAAGFLPDFPAKTRAGVFVLIQI